MNTLREEQFSSPYNNEPVYYCKNCLSLAIKVLGNPEDDDSMCTSCNRTDIGQTDIFTWRKMYKARYGKFPEEETKKKSKV